MGTLNLGSNGKINGHAEFEGRVTKPAHPYMLLRPNSGVTVNNNSHTKISTMFGTTELNQGGIALDTSNGRITFPVVGIYKIRSKVNAATEAHWGNDNQFYLKVNGTTYPHSQAMYGATQKAGGERWYAPCYLDLCANITNTNDYVEIFFYQNSGNNEGLHSAFGFLEVYLIG